MANKAIAKVEREMQKELSRQIKVIFGCTAYVLSEMGWEKPMIGEALDTSRLCWEECSMSNEVSMLQMLENETGIEMQNGDGKSWHDVAWQNADLWDGKLPDINQCIYIRGQQKRWIPTMLMGCMALAVYRMDVLSIDEIVELIGKVDAARAKYPTPKAAREILLEKASIDNDELMKVWEEK